MKEVIAANLIRYRKGLGLSQEQLAEEVDVTRQSINNYENAKTLPDSKTLSALAGALGVTLDDLLRSESLCLPSFRFRVHALFGKAFVLNEGKNGIQHLNNPQFAAQVLRMLQTYNALEQAVGLPTYTPESTPCYQVESNEKRIQTVAAQFRHRLGNGDAPISNLFEAVEDIGLKVLRSPIPIKDFFGLSAYSDIEGAFILVNTHNITIERQLFTLAREIGHLIFHRVEYQDTFVIKEIKEEQNASDEVADYFAAHLLIPQSEFERIYTRTQDIVKLKQHFRVSYLVILKRLAEMGIIDYSCIESKIHGIYKKQHGAKLQDSMELPPALRIEEFPENERFIYLVWNALKLSKISEMKAAELLNITVEQLRVRRQETEVYAVA